MSYYVHDLPGRIRVKIPALKRNKSEAERVQVLLDELTGITDTVANVLTGSVVINYDPRIISSEDILSHLAGYRYIDKAKAISSQEYVERAISQASQTASRALLGLAVEKTFEGSSLALLAALI